MDIYVFFLILFIFVLILGLITTSLALSYDVVAAEQAAGAVCPFLFSPARSFVAGRSCSDRCVDRGGWIAVGSGRGDLRWFRTQLFPRAAFVAGEKLIKIDFCNFGTLSPTRTNVEGNSKGNSVYFYCHV